MKQAMYRRIIRTSLRYSDLTIHGLAYADQSVNFSNMTYCTNP